MNKKWIIWGLIIVAVLILGRILIGCGQQAATPGAEVDPFLKQLAQSMAQQAKSNSAGTGKAPSIQSIKSLAGPPSWTYLGNGWYQMPTEEVKTMTSGKMKFWKDADETSYVLFTSWETPHHIEMQMSGTGLMTGETVSMTIKEPWAVSNNGIVTPEVYTITDATYEVTTKTAIDCTSSKKATGTGTVSSSDVNMSMQITSYGTETGETHVMLYGYDVMSGTATDPNKAKTYTITGTMKHLTEGGHEKMYGAMSDATLGLIMIINADLTTGTVKILDLTNKAVTTTTF